MRVAPDEGDTPAADDAEPAAAELRSRQWSAQAILLGVLALLLMIAAMIVILWGSFAHTGGETSRLVPLLLTATGV